MKKLFLLSLLLLSSCSLGKRTPYAEDLLPPSVKIEIVAQEEALSKTKNGRPQIQEINEDKFPEIINIPKEPLKFPDIETINKEKNLLLNKQAEIEAKIENKNIIFTGFDDEFLLNTVNEILERPLPDEYKTQRALLTASTKEEINENYLKAIKLIASDRKINSKPVLIKINGDQDFKIETVGTLLLLGLNPSLIYVENLEDINTKTADIYLYY